MTTLLNNEPRAADESIVKLKTLAVVLVLAGSLAGCSSSDSQTADPTTPAPVATTPSDEPTTGSTTAPADSSDALDAFVDEAQASVQGILDATPMYSDFEILAVHPDTLEYSYTYAEAVDPAAGEEYFEAMIPTLQTAVDTQVFPAMVSAGITSPHVTYTYLNPDTTVVWSRTFDPS